MWTLTGQTKTRGECGRRRSGTHAHQSRDGCVCFRVVEFASRSDMKSAISKFDGTELNERKLKVFEDSRK